MEFITLQINLTFNLNKHLEILKYFDLKIVQIQYVPHILH